MRRYPLFLAALLLASYAPAIAAASCVPSSPSFKFVGAGWGAPNAPADASPGDTNVPLAVTLLYYGACSAFLVQGTLSLPPGFSDLSGGNASVAYGPPVSQGSFLTLSFPLKISPDVKPGPYTFALRLLWNVTGGYALEQDLTFSLPLRGRPYLEVAASASSLIAGEVNHISLQVSNLGSGNASDLELFASPSPGLGLLSRLPLIADLPSGALYRFNVSLYASSTLAGSVGSLSLTFYYADAYGLRRSAQRLLFFYITGLPRTSPLDVSVEPSVLNASSINSVTLTFANTAATNIYGLQASFSGVGGGLTWLSPSLFVSKALGPGERISVQGRLYVSPSAQSFASLQVSLTYYGADGLPYQEARSLGLLVRGLVNISGVDSTVLPTAPAPGDVFSITITLVNLGTTPALNVLVTPQPPQGIIIFGRRSIYLGDLPPRSPSTVTLTFQAKNDTLPGAYMLPVLISYQDNLGLSSTQRLSVDVTLVRPAPSTSTPQRPLGAGALPWLALVAVGAVSLAAGYALGRRRA